jgi:hypothetical protein
MRKHTIVEHSIALLVEHRVIVRSVFVCGTVCIAALVWFVAQAAFERIAERSSRELAVAVVALPEERPSAVPTQTIATPVSENAPRVSVAQVVSPTIQLIGDTTVIVNVGDSYTDDGARAFAASGEELILRTYVNGQQTELVIIDTSTPDAHEVEYRAVDARGVEGSIRRSVIVR